jgi:hypothetical protein
MGDYLKLFKNNVDYENYKEEYGSDMLTWSHCIEDIKLHKDISLKLICTFNITDINNPTKILDETSNVKNIYIDGVKLDNVTTEYTFNTLGEHIVKYSLKKSVVGGFSGCTNLTDVIIPSGVTKIEDFAFSHCSGLVNVKIPNTVTSIGLQSFASCTNLLSIEIPNSVITVGSTVLSNCGLITISIPRSITKIPMNFVRGCNSLTTAIIPDTVTSIGTYAFYCSSLLSVTCNAINPPTLGDNVFLFNPRNRKIYVPSSSVEAYKSANNWSTYANAIEPIP